MNAEYTRHMTPDNSPFKQVYANTNTHIDKHTHTLTLVLKHPNTYNIPRYETGLTAFMSRNRHTQFITEIGVDRENFHLYI